MSEPAPSEPQALAAGQQSRPRPQVLYVMGAGRSGSTVLGVTLGNCPQVFYAGELDAWLARSGEPQLQGSERERFWGQVRAALPDAVPLYGRAVHAVERSASLLRPADWWRRRRLAGPYRAVAVELYRAIAAAAGTPYLVDSSHYPLRARELQRAGEIDLYLLYLMRDPRSVVASFANREVAQYNKSPLTTNVYLWVTNLLAAIVFLRHPRERRLFVSYEDFVADPNRVLALILQRVGLSELPPDLSALLTGIPFQGNRLIQEQQIALKVRRPPAPARSVMTSVLQFPLGLLLGRLRPRA